ncbi:glycosyltransferase [Paenibacillus wynnii]|uniref:glycosyltransferase n=1 Tax=Paenibacillus wynnii TaxID=268407 RepID=UPI0027D8D15F|nr:glycosyltransferase [Paenibacillus wynnii]
MQYKVSVIIPVYNAEQYLIPCIHSLLSQSLHECQFVFVNDGSEDGSLEILREHAKKDTRMVLIDQDNQGVSAARNAGMTAASGEYIGFVDADDTVEREMFETLYLAAVQDNCDAVITNFESELGIHTVITRYPFSVEAVLHEVDIKRDILPYFIKNDNCNTACSKLYKRQTLIEHGIVFPERVALGEDGMFNMSFFCVAERAKYMDYTGYHYRETPGSATRNIVKQDYLKRALEVYQTILPDAYVAKLENVDIGRLKSIRLIHSALAILHIYMEPTREVDFRTRYAYIRSVVNNEQIQASIPLYYEEEFSSLGRYYKWIVEMMRRRQVGGIYLAILYSRIRNQSKGRKAM